MFVLRRSESSMRVGNSISLVPSAAVASALIVQSRVLFNNRVYACVFMSLGGYG